MAAEVRRLRFLEGVVVTSPFSYSGLFGLSDSVSLITGESYLTVTFPVAIDSPTFKVTASIECDDVNPSFLSIIIKNKTVNGFDILLNGPVDSDNYIINYIVSI